MKHPFQDSGIDGSNAANLFALVRKTHQQAHRTRAIGQRVAGAVKLGTGISPLGYAGSGRSILSRNNFFSKKKVFRLFDMSLIGKEAKKRPELTI